MVALGRYLKQERLKKDLSQTEVAQRLGITNQFLSNIEREVCGIPLDLLAKLIEILKLDKHKIVDLMVSKFRDAVEQEITRAKKLR